MAFTFKQFHIEDAGCGMPVSTDGVLLGAWAPLVNAQRILDIGAGSGLLSLMAAQRSQAQICAVELDTRAADVCRMNFDASPWQERLSLHEGDIIDFCHMMKQEVPAQQPSRFDHIICNPPYFESGPLSQSQARASARHTHNLNFLSLQACIRGLLSQEGQASLILPTEAADKFIALLRQNDLKLLKQTWVSSVEGKSAQRKLLLLGQASQPASEPPTSELPSSLFIRDRQGQYSQAMVALTQEFYLKL